MDMGQSKFEMGQTVWLNHARIVVEHPPCEVCHGAYKQFVDWKDGSRTEVLCKACDRGRERYRTVNQRKVTELWLSGVVCGISVQVPSEWGFGGKKAREVVYRLRDIEWLDASDDHRANVFHEGQMYASLEEAQMALSAADVAEKAA